MSSNKMLVRHVRDYWGRPVATIVAKGPNSIGATLCQPNEKLNRKLALSIASGRADQNKLPLISKKYDFEVTVSADAVSDLQIDESTYKRHSNYFECPVSEILAAEVDIMRNRAKRYFKQPQEQAV